jgi:hypothetical protein
MDAVLLDTCVLLKSYLCDTLLSIAEVGTFRLHPDAVLDALRRQSSRYRREPRSVTALLSILAGPGQGCPEFARQCRTLL